MEAYIDFQQQIDRINKQIIYEIALLIKRYGGTKYSFGNNTIELTLNEDYDYQTIWVESLEWDEFEQILTIVADDNKRYGYSEFTDKQETLKALYDALYMDFETHLPTEH